MLKTLKIFFSGSKKALAESEYLASGTQCLLSLFNDDSRMTFDVLMARLNLCSQTFVWGNVEKIFSQNVSQNV